MIKKLQVLKNDVLVPIEVSSAFYRNIQECSTDLLQRMPDPKQALININSSTNDPNFKLSLDEFALAVLMNIIYEIETVAKQNPEKYIEEKEINLEE